MLLSGLHQLVRVLYRRGRDTAAHPDNVHDCMHAAELLDQAPTTAASDGSSRHATAGSGLKLIFTDKPACIAQNRSGTIWLLTAGRAQDYKMS